MTTKSQILIWKVLEIPFLSTFPPLGELLNSKEQSSLSEDFQPALKLSIHPPSSLLTSLGTARREETPLPSLQQPQHQPLPWTGPGQGGAGMGSTGNKKGQHAWLLMPTAGHSLTGPSPGLALLHGVHFKGEWIQVPFPTRVSDCRHAERWSTWHLAAMLLWARLSLHKACGNQNVPVTGVNLCPTGTDLKSGHNLLLLVANISWWPFICSVPLFIPRMSFQLYGCMRGIHETVTSSESRPKTAWSMLGNDRLILANKNTNGKLQLLYN